MDENCPNQKVPLTSSNSSKDASETEFIKCPHCGLGQPTFQSLREHLEQVHGSEEPTSLGATGTSPPPGATPLPTQNGPYACAQCTSSFNSKDQLEKHELLHSPNAQVSCKTCHKTFANVYRLQRHMISHDESAILRKFKCTECEKAFKFKHHLKEHIRIHSGEKPFECGNCGKRFSHSGSYSSHMTSKKCLVMNLKMGRNRTNSNTLLEKSQIPSNRGQKRMNSSLNNNITSSPNQNSPYPPILPKYDALFSVMASRDGAYPSTNLPSTTGLHPFLPIPPGLHLPTGHPISPYTLGHASLSQLLEHLQNQNQLNQSSRLMPQEDVKLEIKEEIEDRKEGKEEEMDENRNSSRCSNDLVMDTDHENDPDPNPQDDRHTPNSNSNDLDAVKRILDTVNATVTKQLLQVNMQKLSSDSPRSECRSVSSTTSIENTTCGNCKKVFSNLRDLEGHDCLEQSEGLAAKLEQAAKSIKLEDTYEEETGEDLKSSKDEYEDSESITTTDHVNEDGRKVRVRSLIADEQLAILKEHYSTNPRPKREELSRIAEKIGFPVRVVQVWFQNTRARDRREGRLVQIPYSPLQMYPQNTLVPSRIISMGPSSPHEQPLDLSIKKESSIISSPGSSPRRPTSIPHSDSDEAVNLSQKSSRSPTPFQNMPYQTFQNSNSTDFNRSPSPANHDFANGSRLAKILAQPHHRLATMGFPMDRLFQNYQEMNSRSPLLNSSASPGSEKRSWKEEILEDSTNVSSENFDEEMMAKRVKFNNLALKGLSGSLLASASPETEIEGQFVCDQCDKAFSKQSSLARHKYEHSGQRPHKCDECPKAFKHKHHLTEHKRLHSGEKPFQCQKCLKRFSHSGSYSQHMNHRYSYCKPYRE